MKMLRITVALQSNCPHIIAICTKCINFSSQNNIGLSVSKTEIVCAKVFYAKSVSLSLFHQINRFR